MALHNCIILLVCFSVIHLNSALSIECGKSSKCLCVQAIDQFEFQCSGNITKLFAQVLPTSGTITVQCMEKINWESEKFPLLLGTENINRFSLLSCSLSNSTIAEITNKLGINSVKTLEVTYSEDFANTELTSDYFKGLENLEKVVLHHSNIKDVAENTFDSLNKLTELNLQDNNIQLTGGLFKNLSQLQILDLANNKLVHLPLELFQNLTELKALYLWSNRLTTIDNYTFSDLRSLELLELSRNQLEYLATNTFDSLENLRQISLSANNLRNIPENVFRKNVMLEHIIMNRNLNLTSLPNNLFSNLPNLKNVDLKECKLSNLPDDLFEKSMHLQKIILQANEIEHIPKEIFKDLAELQDLNLSHNKIGDLPDDVFSTLFGLKTLNLENNLLTNIRNEFFYGLHNIELINLGNNKITAIDADAFRGALKLKEIVLANNYLSAPIGNVLRHNLYLEKIDLSHNNITAVDNEFVLKTRLQELNLSHNKISHLQFSSLLTISPTVEINLKNNDISTVNFNDAEAMALAQGGLDGSSANRIVYLDGNPVKCDCYLYNFVRYFAGSMHPIVSTLTTIKTDNLACALPTNLAGFPVSKLQPSMLLCSLEDLGIGGDFVEKCEYNFRLWDKSLVVNCTNANFTEVPKLILPKENFFNQTEVYLEKNLLTAGPKNGMGYENVTKLFLSSNNISEISWLPVKLKVLKMDNNNIAYLNDDVLSTLNVSSLTHLTLGNNPLNCDCQTEPLKTYLISQLLNKKVHIDINNITCKNGQDFLVHAVSEQQCLSYMHIVIVFGVLIVSVAMGGFAVLLIFWIKRKPRSAILIPRV